MKAWQKDLAALIGAVSLLAFCAGCVTKQGSRTSVSLTVPYGSVVLSVLFEPVSTTAGEEGASDE